MRKLPAIAASAAVLGLAACSAASSSSSPPAPATAAAAAPSSVPALAPLRLGHFPATADGHLARSICKAWSGLRQQYAYDLVNDTPNQMQHWFSGGTWTKITADANQLGNDPAYSHLGSALGVAMVADDASMAVLREVDRACEKAD